MTVDQQDIPCRNCRSLSPSSVDHLYNIDRKCCPGCDHRPTDSWPARAAILTVLQLHALGPMSWRIADDLMPVVAGIAADALQAEADELRTLALMSDAPWNPHRVWTLLSDRADVRRRRWPTRDGEPYKPGQHVEGVL